MAGTAGVILRLTHVTLSVTVWTIVFSGGAAWAQKNIEPQASALTRVDDALRRDDAVEAQKVLFEVLKTDSNRTAVENLERKLRHL